MITRLLAISLTFCLMNEVSAQETPIEIPRVLFKVAPQNFINNTLKIGAEIFSKDKKRSYAIFGYGRFTSTNNDPYYYEYYPPGFGGEFQFRKYLSPLTVYLTKRNKEYLQGIYVSGYLQGGSYSANYIDYRYYFDPNNPNQQSQNYTVEESIVNYGGGFTIGFHRTLWKVLFIDAYLGGGLQGANVDKTISPTPPQSPYGFSDYYDITDPRYSGVMPKFGLQIGVML